MYLNLFTTIKNKLDTAVVGKDANSENLTPFDIFIFILIALNILVLVIETDPDISFANKIFFQWFELISVGIFTAEYILRIITCTKKTSYSHPIKGRLKYIFTPLMIIDLLAILPFFLHIYNDDVLLLRMFRLTKIIFRIIRFSAFFPALRVLTNSLKRTKRELATSFMMFVILVFISSTLMYFLEHDAQPQVFDSIPKSIYWGVITFTTVGYGDMYPITPPGQLLACITGIFGIIAFAVPTAIISSALIEEFQKIKAVYSCNSCGKPLDDALKPQYLHQAQKFGVDVHCPYCGDKLKE